VRDLSGLIELEANVSRKVAVLICVLVALLVASVGCDKFKKGGSLNINIPGNVAGQILNEAGQGQGFISVQICEQGSGKVVQQGTAEDSGNFFFDKVPSGEYIIKILSMGGGEMASDAKPFKLGPGKTQQLTIILKSKDAAPAEGGGE
jgi:hypothetical protein